LTSGDSRFSHITDGYSAKKPDPSGWVHLLYAKLINLSFINEAKSYHIETMGCQMNERDSETIAGMLEARGYTRTDDAGELSVRASRLAADVIVVNTCSVRENADNRFFGVLGQIKKAKEQDRDKIVAVCGCMMQQEHIVELIKGKYPWVDIVFGTHNIERFPEFLSAAGRASNAGRPKIREIAGEGADIPEDLPSRREHKHKAFVSIMQGCNNFCTYCIVPYARGRERSRAPKAIVKEVRELAADGVKEITLLGQNVNSYAGQGADFPDLLALIGDVPGIERIRFMTSHPKDLSDKLIGSFAKLKNLCPQIHLPIQSGSSSVLKRMNRRYTKEDYLNLIQKLRASCPEIVITTDFIVGFPGETAEDFDDTIDVIERVRFDSAFTFLYSPRKGTPACEYEDQIPEAVKHERFERMVDRLNKITLEKNLLYIGRTLPVLIEGASKTDASMLSGRTDGGKLINFAPPDESAISTETKNLIGEIVPVKITDVNTFSFTGELLPKK
jgi:tRNA-2-methylthio-N6-dimethylallyladenosine synthase